MSSRRRTISHGSRKLNTKSVVLTDHCCAMAKLVVNATSLLDILDRIFSVEDIATFKPDAAVQQTMQTKLGIETNKIIVISSHSWSVAGAIFLGFQNGRTGRPNVGSDLAGIIFKPYLRVENFAALSSQVRKPNQ